MQRLDGNYDDFGNSSVNSEALARAGLDPCSPTPDASARVLGNPGELAEPSGDSPDSRIAARLAQLQQPAEATRYAVVSSDAIRLHLQDDECNSLATVALGPADAVALAHDLLAAARPRFGRPFTEEPIHV